MTRRSCKSRKSNSKSRSRRRLSLQKANGVIGHRVKQVGGEKFAIVCVDPAKHRSEWMMADYFGNLLVEPQTMEHQAASFKLAVETVRQAQQEHGIQDTTDPRDQSRTMDTVRAQLPEPADPRIHARTPCNGLIGSAIDGPVRTICCTRLSE